MAACCCTNDKTDKIAVSCLGRCDLPKHRCLDKEDIGPGRIPPHMGWLYTAKDSPDHQLRCGWRPGHISCPVLRRIEANYCAYRCGKCYACVSSCGRLPCMRSCPPSPRCVPSPCFPCPSRTRCFPAPCYPKPKCYPSVCSPRPCRPRPKYCVFPCPKPPRCYPSPRCLPLCPPRPRCFPSPCPSRSSRCFVSTCPPPRCYNPCDVPPCSKPMVRIIRHNGQYNIITKPDNITNHPSGPFPLKYVIDTDESSKNKDAKFSIEAKFNDQHFDYTSSQSSFVLDFSPPDNKCYKPCPRRSMVCFPCQNEDDQTCPKCGTKLGGKEEAKKDGGKPDKKAEKKADSKEAKAEKK